jgi:CHASE3 domain sensor protein
MRARFLSMVPTSAPLYIGFVALLILMVAVFAFVNRQAEDYSDARRSVYESRLLNQIFVDLLDAETGQRGYLLTGNPDYLRPYNLALSRLNPDFKVLADVADGTNGEQSELAALRGLADQKVTELRTTIDLHDANRRPEALALVNDDVGKDIMERIRTSIDDLSLRQQQSIDLRFSGAQSEGNVLRGGGFAAVLFTIIVGFLSMRRLRTQLSEITLARDELRERLIPLTQVNSTTSLTGDWPPLTAKKTPWFRMDRRPYNCASVATASPLGRADGG